MKPMSRWSNFKTRERVRYQTRLEASNRNPPRRDMHPLGWIVVVALGMFLGLLLLNAAVGP